MIAIPIDTSGHPRPYCYHLDALPCSKVRLRQISANAESDLQVALSITMTAGDGQLREEVSFGRRLSPTSYELDHLVNDCRLVCLEVMPLTDADVRFILVYDQL